MHKQSGTARTSSPKVTAVIVLASLMFGGCATYRKCEPHMLPAAGTPVPPRECRVDGCTLAPNLDFRDCCDWHDTRYWIGGTREQRRQVDLQFRQCIAERDHNILSHLYYFGVRVCGTPYLPTPWRWGFGWEYLHGYTFAEKPGTPPSDPNFRDQGAAPADPPPSPR